MLAFLIEYDVGGTHVAMRRRIGDSLFAVAREIFFNYN